MAKVSYTGQTAIDTKASGKMANTMATVSTTGQTAENTMAGLKMT